jgi:hypothetical protein
MDHELLVRKAQNGDVDAFVELTQRFQHFAFGSALAQVHDFQQAEDIVQEAFVAGRARRSHSGGPRKKTRIWKPSRSNCNGHGNYRRFSRSRFSLPSPIPNARVLMSAAPMRSAAAAKSWMDGTMTCRRKRFILRGASTKSGLPEDGPEVWTTGSSSA